MDELCSEIFSSSCCKAVADARNEWQDGSKVRGHLNEAHVVALNDIVGLTLTLPLNELWMQAEAVSTESALCGVKEDDIDVIVDALKRQAAVVRRVC